MCVCVCVCVCVLCVGVCRDGAGRAYTPSRASDRGVFFVRLCGFLFAWVQYCVCVLVCVGVCWCAWEGGRECSHETTPGGTDKTAVLS